MNVTVPVSITGRDSIQLTGAVPAPASAVAYAVIPLDTRHTSVLFALCTVEDDDAYTALSLAKSSVLLPTGCDWIPLATLDNGSAIVRSPRRFYEVLIDNTKTLPRAIATEDDPMSKIASRVYDGPIVSPKDQALFTVEEMVKRLQKSRDDAVRKSK